MKGWRTIAFNVLTGMASIFGGSEILKYVDAQTALLIVAGANIALRFITTSAVGAGTNIDAVKPIAMLVVAVSLSACSALPTFSSVAPTFCSFATNKEAQAAALALMDKLPDGTDKQKVLDAARIAGLSADAACTLVKALEAQQPKP